MGQFRGQGLTSKPAASLLPFLLCFLRHWELPVDLSALDSGSPVHPKGLENI